MGGHGGDPVHQSSGLPPPDVWELHLSGAGGLRVGCSAGVGGLAQPFYFFQGFHVCRSVWGWLFSAVAVAVVVFSILDSEILIHVYIISVGAGARYIPRKVLHGREAEKQL